MFPPLPELLLLYTLELWVLFQRCCNVEGKCCVGPTLTNTIDDFDINTVKLYVNYLEKCMCWKIRKSLKSLKSLRMLLSSGLVGNGEGFKKNAPEFRFSCSYQANRPSLPLQSNMLKNVSKQ